MIKLRKWMPAYLFLFPSIFLFFLFMYLPIIKGIVLSFQKWSIDGLTWVGMGNYTKIWSDMVFWKALSVTALYSGATVLGGLALSVVIALAIDPLTEKMQNFFKASFYIPTVAPAVIMAIVWMWFYNPSFGLFNYLLGMVGIERVSWLGDPNTALLSVIFMSLAIGQGANILVATASLGGIPKDYFESARIDGANLWHEVIKIKLPMIKPTLLYLLVVNTVHSFQVFAPIYLMTSGGPNGATKTLGYLIYENGFKKFDFGLASAQAVILLIIVLLIAIIQFRFLSSDIEY